MPVIAVKKAVQSPYPSLRTVLWLYFVVLIGTAGVIVGLSQYVDPAFLQLIIALVFPAGLTALVIYRTRTRLDILIGKPPEIISLLASIGAGLFLGGLALWLNFLVYNWLQTNVGALRPPLESTVTLFSLVLQSVAIIPICQGLLFWAVLKRSASGLGRINSIVLVAVLFAMYGLFTSVANLGITVIPSAFIVGLIAAMAVTYTDSAWYGVVIAASYNLFWVSYQNDLFGIFRALVTYLGQDGGNLLSVRWLFLVIMTTFLAFIMVQVIRLRAPAEGDENPPAPMKSYWTLPLVLSVLFILLAGYGEITLRKPNLPVKTGIPQLPPANSSGSTIPPVPATVVPRQ
jgi:hypothetical protein